ncbi:MAG TPA: hypothetical protein VFW87_21710, partial [Pirellulales bacterium]|nr:hypothetical protein [Pirellulales bacterium]
MARIISFVFLLGILLVIAALFFQVMASFFVPLFLAVLLAVMFRPLHLWLVARSRGHPRLAAGATTLAILVIVLAPMLTVLIQAGFEAGSIARGWDSDTIRRKLAELRERTGLNLPPESITAQLDRLDAQLQGLPEADPNAARERLDSLALGTASLSRELRAEIAQRSAAPDWAATDDADQLQRDAERLAATAGELGSPSVEAADNTVLLQRAKAEF